MSEAGEKTFSTSGRDVKRFEFVVPKAGDYDLKIRGSKTSIGCKDEPGAVPYVKVQLEALGSGVDGGPNGIVFHTLFLSMEPAANGFVMTEKSGQLIDLARALGEELNLPMKTHRAKVRIGGTKENPEYTTKDIDIIDPEAVKQMLISKDGAVVRGTLKVGKWDGKPKSELVSFTPAEGGNPFES